MREMNVKKKGFCGIQNLASQILDESNQCQTLQGNQAYYMDLSCPSSPASSVSNYDAVSIYNADLVELQQQS
jgi:hypothetical protein